jgi:hypothetical protein
MALGANAVASGANMVVIGNNSITSTWLKGTVHLANLNISSLAVYANNAAALLGSLVAGDLYRTGGDPDVVCIVH